MCIIKNGIFIQIDVNSFVKLDIFQTQHEDFLRAVLYICCKVRAEKSYLGLLILNVMNEGWEHI